MAFTSQTTTVGGNILLDDIGVSYEVSVIAAGSFAVDVTTTAAATSASAGGDVTVHRLLNVVDEAGEVGKSLLKVFRSAWQRIDELPDVGESVFQIQIGLLIHLPLQPIQA